MSFTINLSGDLERRLEAEAERRGISTDELARKVLEENLKLDEHNGSPILPHILNKGLSIGDRSRETEWLRRHRHEYAGQWVALDGETLIANGNDLKEVAKTARQSGVPDALMIRVEALDGLPFAGF